MLENFSCRVGWLVGNMKENEEPLLLFLFLFLSRQAVFIVSLTLRKSSQFFWSEDTFTLLKVIEDPENLPWKILENTRIRRTYSISCQQ